MIPTTRAAYFRSLDLARGNAASVAAARLFAAQQVLHRTEHLKLLANAVTSSSAVDSGSFVSSLSSFRNSAGGGARAFLSANAAIVESEARLLLDKQRDFFSDGSSDGLRRHTMSATLDRLLFGVSALQVLASSRDQIVVGFERGAASAIGDASLEEAQVLAEASTIRRCRMGIIVEDVIQNVRAHCIEKHGIAPAVDVSAAFSTQQQPQQQRGKNSAAKTASTTSSSQLTAAHHQDSFLGVPSHAAFVVAELLKNALVANINRYGAVAVDDAPPIQCILSSDAKYVSVLVRDTGGGLRTPPRGDVLFSQAVGGEEGGALSPSALRCPPSHVSTLAQLNCTETEYFSSSQSSTRRAEPNYHYSREFGVPFSGHGLGLARSRIFAFLLGGTISLQSAPGYGCSALFVAERAGLAVPDVW